jgi:serine/threonine-protein kinase RsbW
MSDQHSSMSGPVPLLDWADTLPAFAVDVLADSDLTRPYVHIRTPALPGQVSVVRSQIVDWTRHLGLPDGHGQDVVLATDEAVSNAVEHAYPDTPGALMVFAGCSRRANAVRVVVADHGRWSPPSAEPGIRGRGLEMMEKLAQVFRLAHTRHGTTVLLGWSLLG